jgi:hypothetical protein
MTDRLQPDKLEQIVGYALRDLPQRRAPVSLESRVLGELQRRSAFSWWRRSFAHWPLLARSLLIVVCGALIGLTMLGGTWAVPVFQPLSDVGALSSSWVNPVSSVLAFAGGLATLLERTIPPVWFYVGFSVAVMLYLILFGLGAAAYRTLYLQPLNGRG